MLRLSCGYSANKLDVGAFEWLLIFFSLCASAAFTGFNDGFA